MYRTRTLRYNAGYITPRDGPAGCSQRTAEQPALSEAAPTAYLARHISSTVGRCYGTQQSRPTPIITAHPVAPACTVLYRSRQLATARSGGAVRQPSSDRQFLPAVAVIVRLTPLLTPKGNFSPMTVYKKIATGRPKKSSRYCTSFLAVRRHPYYGTRTRTLYAVRGSLQKVGQSSRCNQSRDLGS